MNSGRKCLRLIAKWMAAKLMLFLYACSPDRDKNTEASKPLPATIEKGKQLFHARCINCHRINQEIAGPALKGVEARWPDQQKLYAFIRNSEEVIRNDKYARELWLKYNQTQMLAQPDLADADIRAVLDYINSVSEN